MNADIGRMRGVADGVGRRGGMPGQWQAGSGV